jgi:hypothetical protein
MIEMRLLEILSAFAEEGGQNFEQAKAKLPLFLCKTMSSYLENKHLHFI